MSIRERAKKLLDRNGDGIPGAAVEPRVLSAASQPSQPTAAAADLLAQPSRLARPSIRQALKNAAPYVEPHPSQQPAVLPVTQGATWDRRFRNFDIKVNKAAAPGSISQASFPSQRTASAAPSPPSQTPAGRILDADLDTDSQAAEQEHSRSAAAAGTDTAAAAAEEAGADLHLPRRKKRSALGTTKDEEKDKATGKNSAKFLVDLDEFKVESAAPTPFSSAAPVPSPSPTPAADPNDPSSLPAPEGYVVRMDAQGEDVPPGEEHDDKLHLELTVPGSIAGRLRGYQFEGVRFLLKAYACGRGAILADDMGLGKTLQSIAFISAILGKTGNPEEDATTPELSPLTELPALPLCKTGGPTGQTVASDPLYEPDYEESSSGAPILIVCPASLVDNWRDEFAMWGTFRVAVLHGSSKESELLRIMSGQAEVAITTLETMRTREEKEGEGPQTDYFAKIPWHVVIFDEAHKLKNPASITHRSADRLPTRLRYGLSGTPMLSDHAELFHLMNLLAPGQLGTLQSFNNKFSKPIKFGMKSNDNVTDEELADGHTAHKELQRRLRPLLLRRNKSLISHQMPTKRDHVVWFRMAPMQRAVYRRVLALPDVQGLLDAKEDCPCGSGKSILNCMSDVCHRPWKLTADRGGIIYPMYHECECDNAFDALSNPGGCKKHKPEGCWRGMSRTCPLCLFFPVMHLLRKVASHLELIKANPEDRYKDPVKFERECSLAEAILGDDQVALGGIVQTKDHMRLADTETCGKLTVLRSLLADWAKDTRGDGGRAHKVLVFSNSVRTLRIIEKLAINSGFAYLYLDGSTPQADRQPMVKRFNSYSNNDFLFLISTQAGGVGLNLVGANKVVLFDPSWTPGADLQAMDRAFRLGQTRDVNVYRLLAADTIEQVQYLRQISKQQLINGAIDGMSAQRRIFSGVKGEGPEQNGELWGLKNLLANPLGSAEALELVGLGSANSRAAFHIEEIDPEVMKALDSEAEAAKERGDLVDYGDNDGFGQGFGGVDTDYLSDAAAGEDAGGGGGSRGGGGGNKKLKHGAKKTGLAGISRHETVLGEREEEAALRHNAEIVVAARRAKVEKERMDALRERGRVQSAKGKESGKGKGKGAHLPTSNVPPASMLECLAEWMGLPSIQDAASLLLAMNLEERMEARASYAKEAAEGTLPEVDTLQSV